MRLTLRTLLAYMDEILEPGDQEEIGEKIEESEFAADLVRRTRDVVRRLRLGAPHVIGRSDGLDANTVSDYLDNALPAQRVADFERVCLESDVCLAEVAACHQILALVLGQPADVDNDARQRMYRIPDEADLLQRPPVEPDEVDATAPAVARIDHPSPQTKSFLGSSNASRAKEKIPDYLSEPSGSPLWRIAAALVIVAVLAGGGLFLLAPSSLLEGIFGRGKKVAETEIENDSENVEPPAVISPSNLPSTNAPPNTPSATEVANAGEARLSSGSNGLETAASDSEGLQPGEDLLVNINVDGLGPQEPSLDSLPLKTTPPETTPQKTVPLSSGTTNGVPSNEGLSTHVDDAPIADPPESTGDANPALATYSNEDVLLSYDRKRNEWHRLPLEAPLAAGTKLLALPTFRPNVALHSDITLELAGGTAVTLQGKDGQGADGLEIQYGRIVLLNVGQLGNRLRLQLGADELDVQFGGAGATLAVELKRDLIPGSNPEQTPAPLMTQMYITSGNLSVTMTGENFEIQAPSEWQLSDGQFQEIPLQEPPVEQTAMGEPPEWIDAEKISEIDRRASQNLADKLSLERSANLSLEELVDRKRGGRQREVRSLAARSSVYVGQFEPFVAALNDPDQRAQWPKLIEALRGALALGPEVAGTIRTAFQQRRGEKLGGQLFRMLWGYNAEDLKLGAAAELVERLDDDQRDIRVLALWNLIHVTGLGQSHRLQDPRSDRRAQIRRWRQRLGSGEIVPKADAL